MLVVAANPLVRFHAAHPPRACERPDNTVMRAAHGPGPRSHADCGEYVEQPRLEHSLRNRRWRTNQN